VVGVGKECAQGRERRDMDDQRDYAEEAWQRAEQEREWRAERPDHAHECRDCGADIPCNGDGATCWDGGSTGCVCYWQ
jgi:hypothetical protein